MDKTKKNKKLKKSWWGKETSSKGGAKHQRLGGGFNATARKK